MNYFAVGLQLLEVLKEITDDAGEPLFKKVAFLQSLAEVGESRQFSPACYVVYNGESVNDTAGRGGAVQIAQRYSVILAVVNASSQLTADSSVQMAGQIIPKMLSALNGRQITEQSSPLTRVGGDTASFSTAFSYYPFTFETKIFI